MTTSLNLDEYRHLVMKWALFLFFALYISTIVSAQTASVFLDLPDTLSLEHNRVFSFKVDKYWESRMEEISGQKLEISIDEIAYNGVEVKAKSVKTRGQTTLYFKRKSYSISLKKPIQLGEYEVKKLALNNLAMDKNYFRNRLSFLLMEKIGIFPLQNYYSELRINNNTAGIYLAIQKPEDYVRSKESNLLVRRDYEERFIIEDSHGKDTKDQIKRLRDIRKLTKRYEGQQLYDSLNAVVHMDHYFQWLAFNYLVKNGDYTDELFFYLTPDENRFDIIPWDYDDIFMRQPHESFEQRNRVLDHRLLFSGEEYLDIVIDSDNYLYHEFLLNFQRVLEILNPETIKDIFEKVYRELFPYYSDQEIIAQSEYDQYGLTDLRTLIEDLQYQFQFLLFQRQSVEAIIKSEMTRLSE